MIIRNGKLKEKFFKLFKENEQFKPLLGNKKTLKFREDTTPGFYIEKDTKLVIHEYFITWIYND